MNKNKYISPEVVKTLPILKFISALPIQLRKQVLACVSGNETVFKSLQEIIFNYFSGKLRLDSKKTKRLKKKNKILKQFLCKKPFCQRKRRALVKQTGGFLPILIPAAITAIDLLLTKLLPK